MKSRMREASGESSSRAAIVDDDEQPPIAEICRRVGAVICKPSTPA